MAKQLLAGEQEIQTTRQHWSVFVPALAAGLGVVVVTFVILKVLPADIGGHSLHSIKVVVGLAVALVVAVVLTLRYLRWRFTTYTITNHRVLVSRGVLSRYMESIALDRIQDVSVNQGLVARVFKAGNVEIESAGRDGSEKLRHINDPVGFSNTLQASAQALRTGQPYMPGQAGAASAPGGLSGQQGYVPPTGPGYTPPPPGYNPPGQGGV